MSAGDLIMAKMKAYRDAAPLCETHQPSGGTRSGCLVCGLERLSAALSRIDYLCGEPNEHGISDYDLHYDEDAVVRHVEAALKVHGTGRIEP